MPQVIIYSQDNGVVAIVRPTDEALAIYGIDAIAKKDVPEGKPYKIIDASELPSDRTERDAWVIDESYLTSGVGGPGNAFEKSE